MRSACVRFGLWMQECLSSWRASRRAVDPRRASAGDRDAAGVRGRWDVDRARPGARGHHCRGRTAACGARGRRALCGGSVLASRDRRVPHRLAMIRPYPDGMVLFLAARPARNRTMGGGPGGTAGLIRVARGDDGLNMLGEHGRCRPPGIIPGAVGATRGSSGTAPSAPSDSPENGGTPGQSGLTRGSALCAREELNLHALVGHWHLKPARLPFRHSRSAAVGGSETIAQRRGRPAIHPGRRPASRAASIADGRRAIPPVRRRRTAPRGALTPETRGAPSFLDGGEGDGRPHP